MPGVNGLAVSRRGKNAWNAYIDWKQNIKILDAAQSEYYPIVCEGMSEEAIRKMEAENALPHGWQNTEYTEFLEKRRASMA
ncbi:hypothetical protein [uncultured Phocaeicola sp.]|uniref:hypothetical protein n=1 Tax=uncultured Phocaeicola sp. TaxID=990718 RepID=UPI0025AC7F6F|nr:hypothetical protein [uncultured Phocaeicola sp.]